MAHPDHDVGGTLVHGPWSTQALPWMMIAISGTAYALGARRLRRQAGDRGLRRWEIASFAAGWLTIVIAQVSPLAFLSEQLFSAHMSQHELLMLIAAPLLVLGRPMYVMLWALGAEDRLHIASATRAPAVARTWRVITAPLFVWTLHGLALWVWHLPSLYEAAVADPNIHLVQHAFFLGSAALFWWTVINGRHGRAAYGAAVIYVFTTMLHSGLLGAMVALAPRVWYPSYAITAPPWGLSGLEDQQLAGLIMWVPFGIVFLVIGLALFTAWLGESDRRLRYGSVHALTADSEGVRRDAC
jgi:putative membrane protein